MHEFYNASVVLTKHSQFFSGYLTLSQFLWRYLIGRDISYGVFFLYIIRIQKSGGEHEIKCRNFVKELVIPFHRISAASWGHVVSTIKRAPTGDSRSFFHSHRC